MTTILLVDDDPLEASLMLSRLGREFGDVRRATDATQALCLIEKRELADSLGLVISSHHTLGMGGPAFVNELRARMPHLPVLVLGTASEKAADYSRDNVMYMAKPHDSEFLLKLTRQMLAESRNAVA